MGCHTPMLNCQRAMEGDATRPFNTEYNDNISPCGNPSRLGGGYPTQNNVWIPGGYQPLHGALFCIRQGVTQPLRRHAQHIHFFLPCLLLSAFCMRITGVSCKQTFITFMNHSWIVWSTWGMHPNHQFDMISVLNPNVWHGGSTSPKHIDSIANKGVPPKRNLSIYGPSCPQHPTPALLVIQWFLEILGITGDCWRYEILAFSRGWLRSSGIIEDS